jgi:putative chitinase
MFFLILLIDIRVGQSENPIISIMTEIFIQSNGEIEVLKKSNLRIKPLTKANIISTLSPGQIIKFIGWVNNGENVSGNTKWFKTEKGDYLWSGNVEVVISKPTISNRITVQQILKITPSLSVNKANEYVEYLNNTMEEFSINTLLCKAAFIAQTAHESGGYNRFIENLNYSEKGLMGTWPKKFPTKGKAMLYARNPQKIANYVYANINGNGNEESGDGWRYKGRGMIQITARKNYTDCSKALNLDLIKTPELLEQAALAFRSAGWFWNSRSLNELADREDIIAITKKINGGLNGLEDRKLYYARAKNALGVA